MISAADAERSFSNQKRTRNYLRSTMGQQRLTGLAMFSINSDNRQNCKLLKHYRQISRFDDAKEDLNPFVEFEKIWYNYKLTGAY